MDKLEQQTIKNSKSWRSKNSLRKKWKLSGNRNVIYQLLFFFLFYVLKWDSFIRGISEAWWRHHRRRVNAVMLSRYKVTEEEREHVASSRAALPTRSWVVCCCCCCFKGIRNYIKGSQQECNSKTSFSDQDPATE